MTIEDFFARQSDTSIFVGIDPGAEGAIAAFSGSRGIVVDIPTFKVKRGKGKKTVFNLPAIVQLFRQFNDFREITYVALEVPPPTMGGGKGKASSYAQFRLGCAYAMWPLFLTVKGISFEEVSPTVWKRQMGLNSDKETSRHKALGLFPGFGPDLARVKDHNRAEAIMLAEWLRRKHLGKLK